MTEIEKIFAQEVQRILPAAHALGYQMFVEYKVPIDDKRHYRIDVAFVASGGRMVAIELDGHNYHTSPEHIALDKKRERFLVLAGWCVLRFTGTEITRSAYTCVSEVFILLQQLGASETQQKLIEAIAKTLARLSRKTIEQLEEKRTIAQIKIDSLRAKMQRAKQEREQWDRARKERA